MKNLTTLQADRLKQIQYLNDASIQILDEMFDAGDNTRYVTLAKEHIEIGYMLAKKAIADGEDITKD